MYACSGVFDYTKSLIQGKYKLPILYCLQLDGPTRYNELLRKMETATCRSLTKALKELEEDGLIIRKSGAHICKFLTAYGQAGLSAQSAGKERQVPPVCCHFFYGCRF